MRGTSGLLLIGIGVLHTVFGAFQGYSLLSQISRTTFSTETGRQLVTALGKEFIFWFLFGGFVMLILGHLLAWIEKRLNHPLPSFVGWELLVLSVIGLVILPVSGFWLVLALAIYILVVARRPKQVTGAAA